VRDLGNMGFIFILLYAAIMTIVGKGQDNKQLIVRIVVVAVLINFSLFFTKIVIDLANLLAITFYDAIAPGSLSSGISRGLSNSLMEPLKIQSIWNAGASLSGSNLLIIGIMGTIISLIAAFVFFAVAILFVIRFVVLIFVLALSPIAFLAQVFPELKKYGKQWQEALVGQAFFAPIYFFLTWIVIMVARGLPTYDGSMAEALVGTVATGGKLHDPTSLGLLMNFLIIIALLITSLVVAKEWANKAPSVVGQATKWATGAAGSATLGMAGRFGRGTIGRAGQQVADSEWLKDRAPNSMMARLALATGKKTSGASFDMRNAGFASELGAGKGQKGGFAKDLKDKIDAEKKYADSLKPSDLVLLDAEKKFDAIKKTGTIAEVAEAQKELDKLKGASAEDLRNRKIKEFIARGDSKKAAKEKVAELENRRLRRMNVLRMTMSEEAAKAQIKTENEDVAGLEFEGVKGFANERKENYAKDKEKQTITIPLVDQNPWIRPIKLEIPLGLGRHGLIGPVKRERLEEANAIRKSIKEKKPAEKIAEQIAAGTEAAAEETAGPEPTTPAAPPTTGPNPTP
jgi:hypothetical protein